MSSINSILFEKLIRLVGVPHGPALIDVRAEEDFAADPKRRPRLVRRSHANRRRIGRRRFGGAPPSLSARRAEAQPGRRCLAAACRRAGGSAGRRLRRLAPAGLPLVRGGGGCRRATLAGPHGLGDARTAQGRPHRLPVAHPPLRRSRAVFLFVAPAEVMAWRSVSGPRLRCRGRALEPSRRPLHLRRDGRGVRARHRAAAPLCAIVRGAEPAGSSLAPQASGLLAASLGLSRMFHDDLAQLDAGMPLYDAFYLWCRDATDETHTWHSAKRPGS